jgi:asparagine synthetase B (glutamine-hydrolysing)
VFAGVHKPADESEVDLAAGHLKNRPVCVWEGEERAVFSSTLRVLTELPGLRRTLDEAGVLEFAAHGSPLRRRTPFREIARLAPAECLEIPDTGELYSTRYWRWEEEIPAESDPDRNQDREIYRRFRRAVRRRLGPDTATLSFLSGGLDSRCIVSLLSDLDVTVHTFNFSLPGTQDDVFARDFAEKAGTLHVQAPLTTPVHLWEGDWSFMLREAWKDSPYRGEADVPRPRLVWSGDGGSVSVTGPMSLSDRLAEVLMQGDHEAAVDACAPELPVGLFPPDRRAEIARIAAADVDSALKSVSHEDPLRLFHLYWMFNRTRRHLDGHFEHIDHHRLEFHLPFFDKNFLEALFRMPVQRLLKHRFYHEWLECFPDVTTSVPWQTYPGHLPCPIPHDRKLTDQWQDHSGPAADRQRRNARRIRGKRLIEMALSRSFPSELLDRKRLLVAGLMDQARLRDYGYVLNFAYDVFRHARSAE